MELNKIYQGDCLEVLKTFQDGSVNCCVTSPPYYGLRDYGTATWEGGSPGCDHIKEHSNNSSTLEGGKDTQKIANFYSSVCGKCGATRSDNQVGLESTPEEYVDKMVKVFHQVKRVLKKDGTLWLNLGDSYASDTKSNGRADTAKMYGEDSQHLAINNRFKINHGCKQKDLIGIPWMVAFALRADGWYLRQDIIWHKPNPMPESVTDRCTKSHEYIFLLSKSAKYYFDGESISTPILDQSLLRLSQDLENQKGSGRVPGKTNGTMKAVRKKYEPSMAQGGTKINGHNGSFDREGNLIGGAMANKRSVWTVNTMPYSEAHFATFPERLILDCIKAGCPVGGTVLDPFMGAGTTALVARKLDRNFLGTELNPDYIEIANKRLKNTLGMFL